MLGAKVDTVPGGKWELSHTHLDLSDIGKQLFRTNNEKLRLHQMHQDHVVEPPSSKSTDLLKDDQKVHVWGSSEHTAVQGIYIKDRLFTSQGHLGFDEDMVKRQIELRVESGSLKDLDHAEAAKETADMEHDGEVVAASILRLFHGDDNDIPWLIKPNWTNCDKECPASWSNRYLIIYRALWTHSIWSPLDSEECVSQRPKLLPEPRPCNESLHIQVVNQTVATCS